MFNKFKRAITYICKKIKQGFEIMAEISKEVINGVSEVGKEVISGTKDVINTVGTTAVNRYADHADKKLDMIKSAAVELKSFGSTVHSDASSICSGVYSVIKNNKIPVSIFVLFLSFGISGGLISSELINKKEDEPCLTNSNEQ